MPPRNNKRKALEFKDNSTTPNASKRLKMDSTNDAKAFTQSGLAGFFGVAPKNGGKTIGNAEK